MNQQGSNEIRVFKKFADIAPHPIDINSIIKKEPPEPDISCNLSDGSSLAFELVECIDEPIAQAHSDAIQLKRNLREQLEELPRDKRKEFFIKFGNAMINVTFLEGVSLRIKLDAVPMIHSYLLTLEDNAEGRFSLRNHNELGCVVRRILIHRGQYTGPIFNLTPVTWFTDPVIKRIEGKFGKKYEAKSRIELLVYYGLQPEIIDDEWLESVRELVEEIIGDSSFSRVWIYSISENRVVFVYPPI